MNELLLVSATELATRIRTGEITSIQAVDAHIEQAQACQNLNALVVDRFEQAREEARSIDARIASGERESLPPLAGVPCTIKECFRLTGMPNTSGLKARKGLIADSDATTVARIRQAGAIPLGVTNISELCMWMESSNPVYGRTRNPYDSGRIVGGSSGGEGAIIGAGASPFGLGSDVGGSIRMPAFFNGVFGHKPSGGAVPSTGQFPGAEGDVLRYLSTGPLCRRAADLMPLLNLLAGPDGEDSGCEPMTFGDPEQVRLKGMRVISIDGNGLRGVSKDLRDAQQRVVTHLENAGCHVEHRRIPLLRRSIEIWAAALATSDGDSFSEMLGNGEPVAVGTQLRRWLFGRSDHTLPALALAWAENVPALSNTDDPRPLQWAQELRAEFDELLQDDAIIIYPSYTRVAPRHRFPLLLPLDWAYTAILNVMQLSVTQVPTGLNRAGLPTGVQIVGPWSKDHVPIAVANYLERVGGGWVPPSMVR
jgi:fatty acid amide hydrolase 2